MVGRIAGLVALLVVPLAAHAQPERAVVAKATSAAGTFAARPPDGTAFEVLGANADLRAGDLLVALPGATLASKDGAVTLKSFADYDGRSPLPILETAVALNAAEKGADLAFTLDRGRVDITNTRASGAAVAAVRFWDEAWTVKLDDPGTRVALEICGRWPAGSRFKLAEAGAKSPPAEPAASLVLLVLKGSATVTSGDTTLGLSAPPGPAVLEWDNIAGAKPQPQKLAALPEWADPEANLSERGKKVAAAVEKFRAARAEGAGAALKQFLESADPIEQRVALVTLGATDDLATLGRTLAAAKTSEEWDMGIRVLRHWLGRAPGQDQKLYRFLTGSRGYTEAQAKIAMQLLFGFGAAELRHPETYEVLIDYLGHQRPGIRNLAAWHLVRLAPQGKDIPFKPNGTAAEAAKAQAAWKKLIAAGELPPRPKMK
jgi:hypothetical protein